MDSRPGPVLESERLTALDTLRGFAVLGILVMNIQSFAMPFAAYYNPTTYGNLDGANYWTWFFGHVLADQKFMTIFSLLFGAGLLLLTSRIEARGGSPARVHYSRMAWLLVFGLLHAYLLWYGDILVLYAFCGLLIYPCRKLRPRTLLIIGLLVIAIGSGISLLGGLSMRYWPPEVLAKFLSDWKPPPEVVAQEVAAYRGGWLAQMHARVPVSFEFHTFFIFVWGMWRAGGLMLVGMALYKLRFFSAERSRASYLVLIALAVFAGLPVVLYGVQRNFSLHWDVRYSFFFGQQFNYWGSLLVSLGWIGLLLLACNASCLGWLTRPLSAVGRMAFSNYILQTLVCTSIFYGHGLGLFGRVERVGQIAIVAAVWAVLLIFSSLWLRNFQFGPLEWLWRALTYWQRPPFRRPVHGTP